MGWFLFFFPCYSKTFNSILLKTSHYLLGIRIMLVMNSVLRRYVSVKDWGISRSPVSLCSLMLMKGNHFLHTVKGNRWCHSSAAEFKQSDNLYSRSSSRVKLFLGSSMEGLFVFYLLTTIQYLEKLFLSFLKWNLRKWYDNLTILRNLRRHMKTSILNTLWRDSWKTAPHIANCGFPIMYLPRHQ